MVLSQLDKRIVFHLSNCGIDFNSADTCKSLRISPQTLSYKLRKFEAEKLILGYRFRVDYTKIGLGQVAWVFISIRSGSVSLEDFISKALDFPEVHLAAVVTGEYDVVLKVYSENVREMTSFLLGFQKAMAGKMKATSVHFAGRIYKAHDVLFSGGRERIPFDETDLRILSLRLNDAGKPLGECAKELGLHRNTVSSRWKRMLDEGLVIKKSVIVNPEYLYEIGKGIQLIVFIESVQGRTEELAEKLSKLKEIHELSIVNHPFDLMAIVRVKDVRDFYSLQKRIYGSGEFGDAIVSTNSILVLNSVSRKRSYLSDLPKETFLWKKQQSLG